MRRAHCRRNEKGKVSERDFEDYFYFDQKKMERRDARKWRKSIKSPTKMCMCGGGSQEHNLNQMTLEKDVLP